MKEPDFRIASKPTRSPDVRQIAPPRYPCQAPGCREISDTIACRRHLSMLPLEVQGILTKALATREGGMYSEAMKQAMIYWTEEPD